MESTATRETLVRSLCEFIHLEIRKSHAFFDCEAVLTQDIGGIQRGFDHRLLPLYRLRKRLDIETGAWVKSVVPVEEYLDNTQYKRVTGDSCGVSITHA